MWGWFCIFGHVFCVLKGVAFLNEYHISLNHVNLKLRELNSIKVKLEYWIKF